MLGLFFLFASNILNTLGFLGLRDFSHCDQEFLRIIFFGYAICGFLPFLYFKMWKRVSIESLWFFPWAASLVLIYYLFLNFPGTVSFSQLVVVRSIAPSSALAIQVFLKLETVAKSEWKKIFPLCFLVSIAVFLWKPGGNFFALSALTISFLIAQISGRKFANYPRKEALLILNTTTFTCLVLWVAVEKVPLLAGQDTGWLLIVAFASILYFVQYCFLYGIAYTPPVLSVLGISSSVPIGILIEAFFTKNAPHPFVSVCLFGYMLSVAWITYSMRTKKLKATK